MGIGMGIGPGHGGGQLAYNGGGTPQPKMPKLGGPHIGTFHGEAGGQQGWGQHCGGQHGGGQQGCGQHCG
jgi:hypothetical protein